MFLHFFSGYSICALTKRVLYNPKNELSLYSRCGELLNQF